MTLLNMVLVLILAGSVPAQDVITVTSFPDGQDVPYLGNGIIGYRVKPNPFVSWKAVASGFTSDDENGGWETLAYGPYPFAMDFTLDDEASMVERGGDVWVRSQSLDMNNGELTTVLDWPMGDGRATAEVLQFISRTTPVVSCQQVRLTVPSSGELTIISGVASGPGNEIVADMPKSHNRITHMMLEYASAGNRSQCGVSVRLHIDNENVKQHPLTEDGPNTSRTFTMQVDAGQTVTIQTLAATVTSLYHPEPMLEACRLANWAHSQGFEQLREKNRHAWTDIWKSRVIVTGDPAAQEYLDACLFYTFSSVHPAGRTSMAPFGVSQAKNYFGHVFWDTDTYTTPALLLISPETAKMTIDYRCRNLEQARKRAAIFGFNGALYPWESGTRGEEATPSTVDTGWLQQHVNMCVAIAAWQYWRATGDEDYARSCVWPIVPGVAYYGVSPVHYTDRGYGIRDMMSSHEGMKLHNSTYVNGIAAETLRIADRLADQLDKQPNPRWLAVAERIFIPTGPVPAGSGIDGDILYMHDEGWVDSANVDMYMIGFPFDLPFERDLLRRTYDFYLTLPMDVLSMGVVFFIGDGAFLGDRVGQRELFDRTLRDKYEPLWRMGSEYTGTDTTCFVTTMAGMLQTAMMGMTGLRFEPEDWTKYPACLPEGWEKIEVGRIYLQGKPYRLVAVHGQEATLTPVE